MGNDYTLGCQPDACRPSLCALIREAGGKFQQLKQFMNLLSFMALLGGASFHFDSRQMTPCKLPLEFKGMLTHGELLSLS